MFSRSSASPFSDPSLRPGSPADGGPATEVLHQPLVHWRPVAVAGAATSLLAFGLVVALAASARQTTVAEVSSPPGDELVQAPSTLSEEGPTEMPALPERKTEAAVTSLAAAPPQNLATRSVAIEDLFEPRSPSSACETYGTAIQFSSRPAEAARQAKQESKLVLLLHVSGNFEDAKFT